MTSPMGARTQWASALKFFGPADANLAGSGDDAVRIQAYKLYEDMYFNRPESFEVTLRGEDEDATPIYLPSAKKIVEATNRFLAVDFHHVIDPNKGTPQSRMECEMAFSNLFKRERFYSKFATQRRFGLVRGDALWHITADETKEDGKKISIHPLNPSNYFPIVDANNPSRVIGCHIVDIVQDPREKDDKTKKVARRQTYLRVGAVRIPSGGYEVPAGVALEGVTSEVSLWEVGKWDDRNMKDEDLERVSGGVPQFQLEDEIRTIPVYHVKNNPIDENTFGLSEIAGVEVLINGMNQAITDEDLTLVLQGLGVYWTDAAPPQNPDGSDATYEIGPGTVVEVGSGNNFGRVNGVSSVAPFLDHIKFLDEYAQQAQGVPDIAAGRVDVAVAESGISLRLQMAPILQKNKEKENEMLGVMDQMLHDLQTMWFPAYEGQAWEDVEISAQVGNPLPENREAKIQEIVLLQASGLITIAHAQAELTKYGYNFEVGDDTKVIREQAALARATSGDRFDNRAKEELEPDKEPTFDSGAAKVAAPQVGMPTGITV